MTTQMQFDTDELQLIAFKLGSEEYTVPIMTVQEIIIPEKTTKMPNTPDFVEGVINLRGKIIPIIDGRKKFGFDAIEMTQDTRVMVLELEHHTLGLIVDSVSEVVHLPTKDIEETPVEVKDGNDFLLGVGKLGERLLILLDPIKLLDSNEIQSLAGISNMAKNVAGITEAVKEESKK